MTARSEMRLAGGGTELVLAIEGYQFPEIENEKWDSNWLNVKVDVTHEGASWTRVDPGLLTWEVEALASWLLAIAESAPLKTLEARFVEPFLHFQFVPEAQVLRAKAGYGRLCMDVPVEGEVLRACAAALRSQLRQFPRRAWPSTATADPDAPSGTGGRAC